MNRLDIELGGSQDFWACPRQFFQRFIQNSAVPRRVEDDRNSEALLERCLVRLLRGGMDTADIQRIVVEELERLDVMLPPSCVQDVIAECHNFRTMLQQIDMESVEKCIEFTEDYQVGKATIGIKGMFHMVSTDGDTVRGRTFKCGDRYFTHQWIKRSYEPLVYALALHKKYSDRKRVVVEYLMVKHGGSSWLELDAEKTDWGLMAKLVTKALTKLMMGDKESAVLGQHCSYCDYKSVCNAYKQEILDAFEIGNVYELFEMGMEEVIGYIQKLDRQKAFLEKQSDDLKSIILHELTSQGIEEETYGSYAVKIEQRKRIEYGQGVIREMGLERYVDVSKVDNRKMERFLRGASAKTRAKIARHSTVNYSAPILRIHEAEDSDEEKKLLAEVLRLR